MTQQMTHIVEPGWKSLFRVAGAGALISVGFVLVDIAMSFTGGDAGVGEMTAVEWFAQFNANPFLGLRNAGLFNVINTTLTIPLYLALYWLHRRVNPAYAALALALFLFGAAVYGANNGALAMLSLSEQYAGAANQAERELIAAAGTALLAATEDFTPGTFLGLFLSSVAPVVISAVMLRGWAFRRWVGLAGVVGSGCLAVFTAAATFAPALFAPAMMLALVGGLLMLAWNVAVALGLFRLAARPVEMGEMPSAVDQRLAPAVPSASAGPVATAVSSAPDALSAPTAPSTPAVPTAPAASTPSGRGA